MNGELAKKCLDRAFAIGQTVLGDDEQAAEVAFDVGTRLSEAYDGDRETMEAILEWLDATSERVFEEDFETVSGQFASEYAGPPLTIRLGWLEDEVARS